MHGRYAISKYVVAEMEQDNLLTTTLVTTQINLVDGGIVHWPYNCVGCIVYFSSNIILHHKKQENLPQLVLFTTV
jgi:hypothetical protein